MRKLSTIRVGLKKFLGIITVLFFQTFAWAQDKKVDINLNVNKDSNNWYAQPWVWVVGGAVFIIILVAILRGGGRRD